MNDNMSVEQVQTEDLKAFEQRLTEVVGYLRPYAWRWTVLLIVIAVCTACGAWYWLLDEETSKVSFIQSLKNHPFFASSGSTLIILFMAGIHKRVISPAIITARCRKVLANFNMSCDDTGKLILKPPRSRSTPYRPNTRWPNDQQSDQTTHQHNQ
ncbi:nuclear envelope phosphatase-regulatory subunit 1 isoform X1 [Strongylocentrotus purpuratus]|uniref:Transmembrane protein 188 n=1 Tax=Strongylocentrotus purpuratus TaxID=7668 RepID=A0A7M7G971_STRPU|nr:nuclear envelope phosphatase-regulatory subunit 1 isoform X1 [Strongylocentrotus purpuratus]